MSILRDFLLDLAKSAIDYRQGRTTTLPDWAQDSYQTDRLLRDIDPTGGFVNRVNAIKDSSGLAPDQGLMQGVSQAMAEAVITGRYIPPRGATLGGWVADTIGTTGTFLALGLLAFWVLRD